MGTTGLMPGYIESRIYK